MTYTDLTILAYTSNYIPECFMRNTQEQLLKAIDKTPIVCVSFKPTIIGDNCINIVIGDVERSVYQMYKQVLIAAKEAKTEYVICCEDDMLYHPSHFDYRPKGDKFAYNINKWSIFSWVEPSFFSYRRRMLMNSLIVRREALIKTLEERYAKYPIYDKIEFEKIRKFWGEPGRVERHLKITPVETEEYRSEYSNIMFSTKEALGYADLGRRKAHSEIRTNLVDPWGLATDVVKYYK